MAQPHSICLPCSPCALSHVDPKAILPPNLSFIQNNVAQRPLGITDALGIPPITPVVRTVKHPYLRERDAPALDFNPVSLPSGNVINTNCSAAHSRQALSCKMSVESSSSLGESKECLGLPGGGQGCNSSWGCILGVVIHRGVCIIWGHNSSWGQGSPGRAGSCPSLMGHGCADATGGSAMWMMTTT